MTVPGKGKTSSTVKVPAFMAKDKGLCQLKAVLMWADFDDNDKAGVRFGMFPFAKMKAAEDEGFDGRELCIALMAVAERHGGMRA